MTSTIQQIYAFLKGFSNTLKNLHSSYIHFTMKEKWKKVDLLRNLQRGMPKDHGCPPITILLIPLRTSPNTYTCRHGAATTTTMTTTHTPFACWQKFWALFVIVIISLICCLFQNSQNTDLLRIMTVG